MISGGDWQQFETQVLRQLAQDERLANLSLLPTCGTRFYRYGARWELLYAEDFTAPERRKILDALQRTLEQADDKPAVSGVRSSRTAAARSLTRVSDNWLRSRRRSNGTRASPNANGCQRCSRR